MGAGGQKDKPASRIYDMLQKTLYKLGHAADTQVECVRKFPHLNNKIFKSQNAVFCNISLRKFVFSQKFSGRIG